MRSRSASRFGLACFAVMALALGGCGFTGSSTRAVNTGPPGASSNPQANAPLTPAYQIACNDSVPMMNQAVQPTGMQEGGGPCDSKSGHQAATKGSVLIAQLAADQSVMGMRPGTDMDVVAFGDYSYGPVCFALVPSGSYSVGSMPPGQMMQCNSAEFPQRWMQSVTGTCKAGACAYSLFVQCPTGNCKLGKAGFMLRPKPAGLN